jgi:hypothetical protein
MLDDKCASLYYRTPLDVSIQCKRKWRYYNECLRNVSSFLSATGKWRLWLRCRGVGEISLEFCAGGEHFELFLLKIRAKVSYYNLYLYASYKHTKRVYAFLGHPLHTQNNPKY